MNMCILSLSKIEKYRMEALLSSPLVVVDAADARNLPCKLGYGLGRSVSQYLVLVESEHYNRTCMCSVLHLFACSNSNT